jgi:hypothetical protein
MLYHLDSLHPSVLLCAGCGAAVASLPGDAGPPEAAELGDLTAEQVSHAWPQLAGAVVGHDLTCVMVPTRP